MKNLNLEFDGLPVGGGRKDYVFSDGELTLGFSNGVAGCTELEFHGNQPIGAQDKFFRVNQGDTSPFGRCGFLWAETGFGKDFYRVHIGKTAIYPFGFDSEYEVMGENICQQITIKGNAALFKLSSSKKLACRWCFNPKAIIPNEKISASWVGVLGRGDEGVDMYSIKEKMPYRRIEGPKIEGSIILYKFIDKAARRFDSIGNEIRDGETWIALSGSGKVKEEDGLFAWEGKAEGLFAISCGTSREECLERLQIVLADPDGLRKSQMERYEKIALATPTMALDEHDDLNRIFNSIPLWWDSMKVRSSETEAAFRAANYHYWVWGWDGIQGAMGLLLADDLKFVRRYLNFLLRMTKEANGRVPMQWSNNLEITTVFNRFDAGTFLYGLLVSEYFNITRDKEFLEEFYPHLKSVFVELKAGMDEHGFFLSRGQIPDRPLTECDREIPSYVAMETGFSYCFCRHMESMAEAKGEREFAGEVAAAGDLIRKNFLAKFMDEGVGFVVDSLSGKGLAQNKSYGLWNLLMLTDHFGSELIFGHEQKLADFVAHEHLRGQGVRLVPHWDKIFARDEADIIVCSCYFPLFDQVAAKLFRLTDSAVSLRRLAGIIESVFSRHLTVPEGSPLKLYSKKDTDPFPIPGDTKWTNFSMASWYKTVLESVLGLKIDSGGITYLPCDGQFAGKLDNLRYGRSHWNIEIKGKGRWAELTVDGKKISHTLKTPGMGNGQHKLLVTKNDSVPDQPFILSADGGEITEPELKDGKLKFALSGHGRVAVVFYAPFPCRLIAEGREVPVDWDAGTKRGMAFVKAVPMKTNIVIRYE
ncbi:MAG: hypothetical protein WAX69_13105 [Victivallales bacterium]